MRKAALVSLSLALAAPVMALPPEPPAPNQPAAPPPPSPDDVPPTVFGGEDAQAGEAPWQAQLLWARLINNPGAPDAWQRRHQCGAAVIAPTWVLTAAHCFNVNAPDFDPVAELRVRVGLTNIRTTDVPVRTIRRVIKHPDYVPPGDAGARRPTPHDLALIELAEPLPLDDGLIEALPLAGGHGERDLQGGDEVTFTGWGRTEAAEKEPAEELQLGQLRMLSGTDCIARHGSGIIGAGMVCGFERDPDGGLVSVCGGDSGGPLVSRIDGQRRLAGISIWIQRCGATPSVFTSVRDHLEWIRKTIGTP